MPQDGPPSNSAKKEAVLMNNTFFFKDKVFERKHESDVTTFSRNLNYLSRRIDSDGFSKPLLVEHITTRKNGLDDLLAISSISQTTLEALVTYLAIRNSQKSKDSSASKRSWWSDNPENGWTMPKIKSRIKEDRKFAEDVVELLTTGYRSPLLKNSGLSSFELKKLHIDKSSFKLPSLLSTIVRYKVKGAYHAKMEGNPESVIIKCLEKTGIRYESGKLTGVPRRLDFVIPDMVHPRIIVECSYQASTGSSMGDKAKTEQNVGRAIRRKYPNAVFVGFVDGIGWYVRKGDLERIVKAFDLVFTFKPSDMRRFENLARQKVKSAGK